MQQLPKTQTKLFLFFFKADICKVSLLVLMAAFFGSIPSIDGILLKHIIDTVEFTKENELLNLLKNISFWMVTYALWWESINIVTRIYDYLYLKTLPSIKGRVVDVFYDYIQQHSYSFFQEKFTGNIANKIMDSSRAIEYAFGIINERILRKGFMIICALYTMFYVHHIFALIFFIWLVVFCGFSVAFSTRLNKYSTNFANKRSVLAGVLVDTITNINSVRMFFNYKHVRKHLNKFIAESVVAERGLQWFMLKLRYFLGLSCSIMIFIMIYYLAILRIKKQITVGDLVLILSICLAVVNEIWELSQEIGDFYEELGAFNQSISLLEPYIILDKPHALDLKIQEGKIEFKEVVFRYKQKETLFSQKSIVISGKQKVGLVGFSGSGKTTFVQLINRLYDIDSGEIFIDNQNIANVKQESLRRSISFIPQDPMLFNRNIKENIAYGNLTSSLEEIQEAAKKAYIHDFIMSLPDTYYTTCGEKGASLSGGQKQRIIIARAILKNAPILILDEATSALDTITENLIQESLNYLMGNKTVLVIAHRLSTLLNMDRIIVFDKGRIVQDGAHLILLKDTDGLYYKLWNMQFQNLLS